MAALVIAALLISLNFKSPSSVGDTAALDARSSPVVSATSLPQQPEPDTMVAQVDVSATEEESLMTSELDTIDRLSVLLSSQDTSNLTDGELAMLLY